MRAHIIALADYLVPSYRRTRRPGDAGHRTHAARQAPDSGWSVLVRQRTTHAPDIDRGHHPSGSEPGPSAAAPVRTVCLTDRQVPGAPARLRISGRLIDVCAELERLAAAEAADIAARPRRA